MNSCRTLYISHTANAQSTILKRYLNNIFKLKKSVSIKNPRANFTLKEFEPCRLSRTIIIFYIKNQFQIAHHISVSILRVVMVIRAILTLPWRLDNESSGANYHFFTTFSLVISIKYRIPSSSFYSSLKPLDSTALT